MENRDPIKMTNLTEQELARIAEYLAQQAKEEWKVGEWATCNRVSAIVQEIHIDKNNLLCTKADGWAINLPIDKSHKSTEEEIFNHLKAIAEKKYPVGTKVKINGYKAKIGNNYCYEADKRLWVNAIDYEMPNVVLWQKSGWAEIVEPAQSKKRWEVSVNKIKGLSDDYSITIETNWDSKLSNAEAEEVAQKIRKLLNR
jgi:hypothetical protein